MLFSFDVDVDSLIATNLTSTLPMMGLGTGFQIFEIHFVCIGSNNVKDINYEVEC